MPPSPTTRSDLSGADWFLASLEPVMQRAGQGHHFGLTILCLGEGFCLDAFRGAVHKLEQASPIANARLLKRPFGIPRWEWHETDAVKFPVKETEQDWETAASELLREQDHSAVRFCIAHHPTEPTHLLMRWRHALLDGKGAELLLAEIARCASQAGTPALAEHGALPLRFSSLKQRFEEATKFKNHFYQLTALRIRSLGGSPPRASKACFYVEKFTREESKQITQRAESVTRGLFQVAWFLAASMRAHHAVLLMRGDTAESFQSACAVQERKRGARQPIWQNQVSQLFFHLTPDQLRNLESAAETLQTQFRDLSARKMDQSFSVMLRFFRRLPRSWYRRMLMQNSGGHLTSFFFSHTGEFLPECQTYCGAPLLHGWHIPTVSQPPGTGLFFSTRDGCLTATFSWRDDVLTPDELACLKRSLRSDLLGS